jgi:hypothetical protein
VDQCAALAGNHVQALTNEPLLRFLVVAIGPNAIRAEIQKHSAAFLVLPEVKGVAEKAHPQVAAVLNRFALTRSKSRISDTGSSSPGELEQGFRLPPHPNLQMCSAKRPEEIAPLRTVLGTGEPMPICRRPRAAARCRWRPDCVLDP